MRKHLSTTYVLIIITAIISGSCARSQSNSGNTGSSCITYLIDTNRTYQTIDNFGASDAWNIQYIGLWPEEKQKQIATWLFSTGYDNNGNPEGIGLSLWRFYIGAGSKEQGNSSNIDDVHRRNECFLLADGTYDWQKQAGQRNFLREASSLGVKQFLGFIYSPPVHWTKNGLATNLGRNGTFNLQEDKYDDFARYIADIVENFEKFEGISFNYISPFNEPDGHWNWDGRGQEGTAATKSEIARTIRLISKEFEKRQLRTEILIPESSDLRCLYSVDPHISYDRGFQIQSYFSPDSTSSYIGNLYNVPDLIVGHSYWTNTPLEMLRETRMKLNETLKAKQVRFWQSELCVMSNDEEIGGGHKKDLGMNTALYIARIIHHDMVYANSSAWHWWLAVSSGDYKDGLIYTEPNEDFSDGLYTDSKLMWSLGNYSRFIRPGAKRISVSAFDDHGDSISEGDTDPYSLMISSYKNTDNSIICVIINYSQEDKNITLKSSNSENIIWQPYLTTDGSGNNLKRQSLITNNEIFIPARSILTLTSSN